MIILVSANALTLVYKGFAIGLQVGYGGNLLTTIIIILLLFLPSLIIAMITTVGTNFRINVQHPALVLLPTFTFFSYMKGGCCGGEPDHKIMFSRKMTMFNMMINGLCFGAFFGLVQMWPFEKESYRFGLTIYLLFSLPLFIPAIILSIVFLYMKKCCGCCLTVTCHCESKVSGLLN